MNIDELRKSIDDIDGQILALINKRYENVIEIGKLKKNNAQAIYVPEREKKLLSRLEKINKGPMRTRALNAIFREIISGARELEHPIKIAYSSGEHISSKYAVSVKFGKNTDSMKLFSIKDVLKNVESNKVDYGIVPVENSIKGVNAETLDELMHTSTLICSEIRIKNVPSESSARSKLSDEELTESVTRFFVMGKQQPEPTGHDKTTICYLIGDESGALCDTLLPFKKKNISITMIEKRPSGHKISEHYFFIDYMAHLKDRKFREAVSELEKLCVSMKILGSYPVSEEIL